MDVGDSDLDTLVKQSIPPGDPGFKKMIGDVDATTAAKTKELEPIREEMATSAREGRKASADKFATIEPFKPPPAPDAKNFRTDPVNAFGSWGAAFAMIASAFTHRPMTNALNAAASAMNAIRDRDAEAYHIAHEAWKDNTKIALERHETQMEEWQALRDKNKDDLSSYASEMAAYAAKYDDKIAMFHLKSGLLHDYDAVMRSRSEAARGLLSVMPQLEQLGERRKVLMNDPDYLSNDPERMLRAIGRWQLAINPRWGQVNLSAQKTMLFQELVAAREKGDPTEVAKVEDKLKLLQDVATNQEDPENRHLMAQAIADYRLAPPTPAALARSPAERAKMAEVFRINPQFQGDKFTITDKTVQAFGPNGAAGKTLKSLDVAEDHILTARELIEALRDTGSGKVERLNAARQEFQRAFGTTSVPDTFDAVKGILADEVEKSIIPTGGTMTERQATADQMRASKSPQILSDILDYWERLLGGQLGGLKRQWTSGTKGSYWEDKFDEKISEHARESLERAEAQTEEYRKKREAKGKGGGKPAFEKGKTYTDAKGRKAKYLGDDADPQWEPVK